jgi:uncharacterized protein (TIGR00725 family)
VTVFGGSQAEAGSRDYTEAYDLGKLLARRGHTVMTGGYMGTMEAVSRGAHEMGGDVIGVTCAEIEHWRATGANQWVKVEWRKETLIERLQALIEGCDAAISLPGGPGTMAEILLMWNLIIIGSQKQKRLIVTGEGWRNVFNQLFLDMARYIPPAQRRLLSFAPDVNAAVGLLE